MKWLGIFACVLCAALSFCDCPAWAQGGTQYVVTARITPLFETVKDVKAAPGGQWKDIPYNEGILGVLVYGDLVEGKPSSKKGWLSLSGPEGELGLVEAAALTPMPKYEPVDAKPYQVMKDGTVPFLLPGQRPVSEFHSFSLPRGAVVTAEGRAKDAEGTSWLLCIFGTDYSDGGSGSDRRGGWLPEAELVDLSASKPELSRVEEDKLPAKLDGAERKALLKNGFYVDPKPVLVKELNEDDMVDAYNTIDSLTPRFITADLPLHAFHLYFDRMLQKVEQKVLLPRTFELLSAMTVALKDLPHDLESSELGRNAASAVVDYLALAMHLLTNGGAEIHDGIAGFAKGVMAGEGTGDNPFTGLPQDFTLFAPRGHYTLNEDFKAYFRTTYLLGTPFPLDNEGGAAATLLLCHILSVPQVQEKWRALYDPIRYLVGSSNVNTWDELVEALKPFKFGDLSDAGRVKELLEVLDKAGKASAIQKLPGKKFAVLPRRITFDAMIFDTLTHPRTSTDEDKRALPDPLDVMAVLGSPQALDEVKPYEKFKDYGANLKALEERWPEYRSSADGANAYTAWLSALRSYNVSEGAQQFFARTAAWGYKKLTTAEASMAELKHDTILYAEQSGAEMGDGGGEWVAGPFSQPFARGYVEPEPKLYRALAESARKILEFLTPMFPDEHEYYRGKFSQFSEEMETLAGIADRALEDAMTPSDFLTIIELRLPSVLPEDIYDVYDKASQNQLRMALVADVATDASAGRALFMGVGAPRRLSVYVNDRSGGFRVTKGYMFSYYSFIQSLSEGRMNDDQWKAIVYDTKRQDDMKQYLPAWHGKLYE